MSSQRDREAQEVVDQIMYLLTGPYVGFPGWEDMLRDHRDAITLERMKHHREIFRDQLCTEYEAMLYLSTASLAHPIAHDSAQIALWLFSRWQPQVAKEQAILPDRPELNPN